MTVLNVTAELGASLVGTACKDNFKWMSLDAVCPSFLPRGEWVDRATDLKLPTLLPQSVTALRFHMCKQEQQRQPSEE